MRLTVENFQSLRSVSLDIEGLTVIVGPSDRGKSALIRALEGALFNRPGETFVRTGTTCATVTIEWNGHKIVWTKGGGKNKYEIDGTEFGRVGTKTPPQLEALGFREELIGARINSDTDGAAKLEGGTRIRPQIADQHDPIFLLKESGTVLNDVIVRLSRLGVLQRAYRQCSLDHGSTKRLLTTRRSDLDAATAAAEKLAQAPMLRARLDALLAMERELDELRQQVGIVKRFLSRRRVLVHRLQHALPTPARTVDLTGDALTAQDLKEQYVSLKRSQQTLVKRARLVALPKKLPKHNMAGYQSLLKTVEQWQSISTSVGARQMRLASVDAAENHALATRHRVKESEQAVEQFRKETPFCPLCVRPWAEELDAVGV